MALTIHKFKADIDMIGINPFVFVPENILKDIFKQAGKEKGPIPIKGNINDKPYKQTLVKFKGYWRLYINTTMLKNSPDRIGETIKLSITFDSSERKITPHPEFVKALEENGNAKIVFDGLPPSRQHEIIRYISFLKTEKSIDKNIKKAIDFLLGNGKFVGRNKP
ncbi:YdeI/OmpD-associated family protein [Treponema primitia]|uniref:YdeI/OmpD-associated family protein n=1 Tax=Treponema primitia TaxID=88058 RepID=UPI0002554C36|nr:YdeI/OmpD-associated family protein [Treponema primitia]